jgi:hypothetical protein
MRPFLILLPTSLIFLIIDSINVFFSFAPRSEFFLPMFLIALLPLWYRLYRYIHDTCDAPSKYPSLFQGFLLLAISISCI